jgi:hypothetical protein
MKGGKQTESLPARGQREDKMKVKFKHMMNGYTGIADDSVIYYMQRINRCVVRKRPRKHDNPSQSGWRNTMRNIFKIHPSAGYKADLMAYLEGYQKLKHPVGDACTTWSNLYMKLLFAMQKQTPGIELATITRQQIYDQNLPCISVKAAVEAGLLPVVKDYESFDKLI